jgi:hypothetical protein
VTERPIIFSGPMVRALLAGRKTQTRRIVKGVDECPHGYDGVVTATVPKEAHLVGKHCFALASGESLYLRCPYGVPGDRLWVRETHAGDDLCGWAYRADHPNADIKAGELDDGEQSLRRWIPSIHMKRAACRLRLEVTGVRVERLFNITEADCRAEGMLRQKWTEFPGHGWTSDEGQPTSETARRAFEGLWHSINGAWLDCWVWVVEFKREQK